MNIKYINRKEILQNFSFLAFILLFPMSFIYHSAIGILGIPSFLGGYFSFAAIFLTLIYSIIIIFVYRKIPTNYIFFCTLMLSWIAFISFNYVVSSNVLSLELYKWGLVNILANTACFIIAANIDLEKSSIKKYLRYFLILFSIIVLKNINNGQFYLKLQTNDVNLVTYQSFGLYILVTAFVLYTGAKSFFEKVFLFAVCFVILYLNGARSEFIFYIISILSLMVIEFRFSLKTMFGSLIFILTLILGSNFIRFPGYIMENRTLQIADITNSSSYLARDELNSLAISTIKNNPLSGSYGSYLDVFGVGGYAHNILSIWADFGLIIFLLIFSTTIYIFIYSVLSIYKVKVAKNNLRALFLFSLSLIVGYLFAKDYSYMFFGLTLGLYVNCRNFNYKKSSIYESKPSNISAPSL